MSPRHIAESYRTESVASMTQQPIIREATDADLETVVRMLAEDDLGKQREYIGGEALDPSYLKAFHAIRETPNHSIIVAELEGQVVGAFELSFIPGLTYQGRWRAQIEAVRVAAHARGHGIGSAMMQWAIARARERGCCMVQLTSDKRRSDAIRFYESQGFQATHEGFKLRLLEKPNDSSSVDVESTDV